MLKKIFNLPKNYMQVQNENSRLNKEITDLKHYNKNLEKVIANIGYDLSGISNFISNKTVDEFQDDIKDIQDLGTNLNGVFKFYDDTNFGLDRKASNAEFIERALFQLLMNKPNSNYSLIKNAIRKTNTKSIEKI